MTKIIMKHAVLCANKTPRTEFKRHFNSEIDQFIQAVYEAYKLYEKIDITYPSKNPNDLRKAYTAGYLYKAIQDLVSAFNIFISGYIVPSGNLMRHFHESAAMAILLSCQTLNYFNKFMMDHKKFPINKVFDYIGNNIRHFVINPEKWKTFVKIKNVYHSFSHSTLFAISTGAVIGSNEKLMVLGSYFDAGKIKHYAMEINRMISAASSLKNIIIGVEKQLNNVK